VRDEVDLDYNVDGDVDGSNYLGCYRSFEVGDGALDPSWGH
jgi:hypothetical protein